MEAKRFCLLIRNQVLTSCRAADAPGQPEDRMLELEDGWLNLPEGLTAIKGRAFRNCGACKVRIPFSVRRIGKKAFFHSECTEVVLPEGLTQIEDGCFEGSNVCRVHLPQTITRIGSRAFRDSGLSTLELPAGLETIDEAAFEGCEFLRSLTIPEGIRELPADLCSGCRNLEQIIIPDSVQKAGSGAFEACESLETIHFPDRLEELPDNVCADCISLTSVHFPANLKKIGDWAFRNCLNLDSIQLPDGLLSIGEGAFQWTDSDCGEPLDEYTTDLEIPASVCNLPDLADLFEDWFVRVTIRGKAFLQSVPEERPWFWGKTKDRVLRAPDVPFPWLPDYIRYQHLRGFAELYLEGSQMEEMARIVNMVGLEVTFYRLWPFEPACAVLLDQKNLDLSCAQDQVKKATEEDMPELVAVLLEYINRTFTQEELDLEREKRQKAQQNL